MRVASYLALRQLRRSPRRSAAIISVLALLISLVSVFSVVGDAQVRGLSGLVAQNEADLWVMAAGAQGALAASRVDPAVIGAVEQVAGVAQVSPIGEVRVAMVVDEVRVDASLWGIDPDGAGAPPIVAGRAVRAGEEAIVDGADVGLGLVPGREVRLPEFPISVRIVGLSEARRYASIPTVTVDYATWERLVDELNPDSDDVFPTVLAVRVDQPDERMAVAEAIEGSVASVTVRAPAAIAEELPGIAGLRASFGAAALVALVAVIALAGSFVRLELTRQERSNAELRAVGVMPRTLGLVVQLQVLVATIVAALVAVVLVAVAAAVSPPRVPIAVDVTTITVVAVLAWVGAAAATARWARTLGRIDPSAALRQVA